MINTLLFDSTVTNNSNKGCLNLFQIDKNTNLYFICRLIREFNALLKLKEQITIYFRLTKPLTYFASFENCGIINVY